MYKKSESHNYLKVFFHDSYRRGSMVNTTPFKTLSTTWCHSTNHNTNTSTYLLLLYVLLLPMALQLLLLPHVVV